MSRVRIPFLALAAILIMASAGFAWWANHTRVPEINKETAAIKNTNDGLEMEAAQLRELYENFDQYLADTKAFKEESNRILQYFPTFMYIEDKVLYVDSIIKSSFAKYGFTKESYSENELMLSVQYTGGADMLNIYEEDGDDSGDDGTQTITDVTVEKVSDEETSSADSETTAAASETAETTAASGTAATSTTASASAAFGEEGEGTDSTDTTTLNLYRVNISMEYSGITYKMAKRFLDYGSVVNIDELLKYSEFDEKTGEIIKFYTDSDQRFVVGEMTMGFDTDTGKLSGTVSFYTYFVSGPDDVRHYEFPQDVIDDLGDSNRSDDLFGVDGGYNQMEVEGETGAAEETFEAQ